MEAMVLVRHGAAETAFERRTLPDPKVGPTDVRISVEAFGLNFADCMARIGVYRDAPPLPAVLGYEVVGRVESVGAEVTRVKPGDRVLGFTRFGGYATLAVTDHTAVARISEDADAAESLGLPTQFGTAYYCAEEMVRIYEGDRVLIQAGAGGVGIGLVQLALRRGAEVFATAGSPEKIAFLKALGVHHPINYNEHDFAQVVRELAGENAIDVAFDSIGGSSVGRAYKLLGSGGRVVCYGAAEQAGPRKNIFRTLKMAAGFPFTHPIPLLMASKSVIGVNMLRIADDRPATMARVLDAVIDLSARGDLKVHVGGRFSADQVGEAHAFLHGRKSIGKVSVHW